MVKGIKMMIISVLLASIMMPFSVSADTITTSNILSVNRTLIDVEFVSSETTQSGQYTVDSNIYVYNFHFVFDYSYLGWVNISPKTEFIFQYLSSGQVQTQNRTFTAPAKTYYVSGNTLDITVSFPSSIQHSMISGEDVAQSFVAQYELNSSSLTKYSDLNNVESVISILDEVYQYVSIDQYTELQSIVSKY